MPESSASPQDLAFATLQRLLPTRTLSALMFRIAEIRNRRFKDALIRRFMRHYPIDLREAEIEQAEQYANFNAFFTRALKPGSRTQPARADVLGSPVDGTISQFGKIAGDTLIQAKGHGYSAAELLADADLAAEFHDGDFCTIYLAPYNYHRVHAPYGGRLRSWTYVPGRLFSVNPATARALPQLFARNERMVAVFDTDCGPLAVVMVGALFVGGIETVWGGRLTPPHTRAPEPLHFGPMKPFDCARGDELGRFFMGSTVILLTPPGTTQWQAELAPAQAIRLGAPLADFRNP